MFGKKKTIETPIQAPKPLPKSSIKQVEPIEAEEVGESDFEETEKEQPEFGDSGNYKEETKEELTEEIVVAYLESYGRRLDALEAALFRLKGAL